VRAYLEQYKKRFQVMTVDFIVSDIRHFGPDTTQLLDSELRAAVSIWLAINAAPYTLPVAPTPPILDTKIVQAVKKAVTTLIDGVDIKTSDGKINIGVTGVTAELLKGDVRMATSMSWGGTLGVDTSKGDFHFHGELASDHWKVVFSYPEDTMVPDLSKLGKVFGEGEAAMRGIARATSSFKSLPDVGRVKDAISPYIQPVSDAVDAVKGIAKTPAKRVSFGFSVGSPTPMPGQTTISPGIQGTATLTVTF
jgi:hypothetical protein